MAHVRSRNFQSVGGKLLLVAAALVLMGTSRALEKKILRGRADRLPQGLVVEGPVVAFFGENVNNQGCSAPQRLDMVVDIPLRNTTSAPVQLEEAQTRFVLDGKVLPIKPRGGKKNRLPFRVLKILPNKAAVLRLQTQAFVAKGALRATDRIEVLLPVGADELHLLFSGVKAAPIQTNSENTATWSPRHSLKKNRSSATKK